MSGYQRPEGGWRYDFKGMKTDGPADSIDAKKYPLAINIRSVQEQTVQTRPGYTLLFQAVEASPGQLAFSSGCPAVDPEIDMEYAFQFTTTGGTAPVSFALTGGSLPAGMSISPTGLLGGVPTESGTFPFQVTATDSGNPVQTAVLNCEVFIAGINSIVDATYTESSPRTVFEGGEAAEATRYLYILHADKLYRSMIQKYSAQPSDWSVWEEEAMPANATPWTRIYGNNVDGGTVLLSTNLKIATKSLCNIFVDPLPQADNPFTVYNLPEAVKPNGGFTCAFPPDFYTSGFALNIFPLTLLASAEKALAAISSLDDPYPNPAPCTTYQYFPTSNNLPEDIVWNRLKGADNVEQASRLIENMLAVGVGNKFARWFDEYTETAWSLLDCVDGDWKDIEYALGTDLFVAVGVGENQIMASSDFAQTFVNIPAPEGAVAVNPRIVYDPNMYTETTRGTFISPGWEVDGVAAVVLIPVNDDESLGTPILAGLPELPANTVLRAVALGNITEGALLVGTDGTNCIILSNPEGITAGTPATYDDWTLKTLEEAPFS